MLAQATKTKPTVELPPIPDKRYFTIGEVSKLCDIKPHVLRYWEQEFKQLNPSKRRGNRRYYQKKDVLMIREIRRLLYDEGFTIIGARQQLASFKAIDAMDNESEPLEPFSWQEFVTSSVKELEHLLIILDNESSLIGA